METNTHRHIFKNIPLTVTGKVPVARISGEVTWKREDTKVRYIFNLMLEGEDGGLIEITPEDDIWDAVNAALTRESLDIGTTESAPSAP